MGGHFSGRGAAVVRGGSISRREWLGSGILPLLAGAGSPLFAQTPPKRAPLTTDDERVVAAFHDRARKAGLGTIEIRWTEHFLGMGDAPQAHIARAVDLCESFSKEFLEHFKVRELAVKFQPRRMVVIALKDADSYQAYSGGQGQLKVGGHYDVDTNELVVFDFRPGQAELAAGARRVNTFTLVHETAHMLCYNAGLLTRGREIPATISEGLATYAELWAPPRDRTAIGRVNHPRLRAFDQDNAQWIPIAELLANDGVFDNEKTADMAYAESWLLVHDLLRQPAKLPRFQAYLAGFPMPGEKPAREAYAQAMLGPLNELNEEIRRYARRMRSRRR